MLNVFRPTREAIKFGPNNGIYLGDKMEGRVGWKIIGSSLDVYTEDEAKKQIQSDAYV